MIAFYIKSYCTISASEIPIEALYASTGIHDSAKARIKFHLVSQKITSVEKRPYYAIFKLK